MQPRYQDLPEASFHKVFELYNKAKWLSKRDRHDGVVKLWNLSNSDSQRELIVDLLSRFEYMESEELYKSELKIQTQILDKWNLSSSNTRIVAIADNSRPDTSQTILQHLKNQFVFITGWKERNFINNIVHAAKTCCNSQQLVIIDDFIGTGNKVKRKTEYLLKEIREGEKSNIKIYICSIAAMNIAKHTLDNLNVKYYSASWLKKGISDHYEKEAQGHLEDMIAIEKCLGTKYKGKKLSKFSLGYGKSEALFAIHDLSVPNNVFPIFWWPILKNRETRKTILNRIE